MVGIAKCALGENNLFDLPKGFFFGQPNLDCFPLIICCACSYEQYQVYKIPLNVTNEYGFSPAFAPKHGGSLIPSKLGSREDAGVDVGIRLPISGAIGVAVNGVPIYPSFDNADYVVWEVCEGDACSSHAGKGGDYHYHGDPYGAYCMYNQV